MNLDKQFEELMEIIQNVPSGGGAAQTLNSLIEIKKKLEDTYCLGYEEGHNAAMKKLEL